MNQAATTINAEEVFGDFSSPGNSQNGEDTFEKSWNWPNDIGNGFMSVIRLRQGIFLEIGDYRLLDAQAIIRYELMPMVCFGFSISGSTKYSFDGGDDKFWGYRQGYSVVGFNPKQQARVKPSVGSQRYVFIWVDPVLLKSFVNKQLHDLPFTLQNIISGLNDHYYQESITTPYVNMAIHQIMTCPYYSSLKRLYIESKALELISYSLGQLIPTPGTMKDTPPLLPDDKERIWRARDILISNLDSPPSLIDLAKRVGTNKTTLNKGFRQLFGTSTFDYLRTYRLERARTLLKTCQMNVTQAALEVGYSRQSCFTRAYKDYFGHPPKGHFNR